MPKIHRAATVAYSDQQMFDLVNNIEAYPQFLRWCSGARVTQRSDEIIEAMLDIGLAGFSKSFSTRNRLTAPRRIDLQLVAGPFKSLTGRWQFEPIDSASSRISLDVEFTMPFSPFSAILSPMFEEIAGSQVDAFRDRATVVYGQND